MHTVLNCSPSQLTSCRTGDPFSYFNCGERGGIFLPCSILYMMLYVLLGKLCPSPPGPGSPASRCRRRVPGRRAARRPPSTRTLGRKPTKSRRSGRPGGSRLERAEFVKPFFVVFSALVLNFFTIRSHEFLYSLQLLCRPDHCQRQVVFITGGLRL